MKLKFEKCMNRRAYTNPLQKVQDEYVRLDRIIKKLEGAILNKEKNLKLKTIELITRFDSLSPLKILTRGYVITENKGSIMKSVKDVKSEDEIDIRFVDGTVKAKVQEVFGN